MIRKTITVEIDDNALLSFYNQRDNFSLDEAICEWIVADQHFMSVEEMHDALEPNLLDKNIQL